MFQSLSKQGILLDSFYALTHPSEPNYIAAVGGDFFGSADDDFCESCPFCVVSAFTSPLQTIFLKTSRVLLTCSRRRTYHGLVVSIIFGLLWTTCSTLVSADQENMPYDGFTVGHLLLTAVAMY